MPKIADRLKRLFKKKKETKREEEEEEEEDDDDQYESESGVKMEQKFVRSSSSEESSQSENESDLSFSSIEEIDFSDISKEDIFTHLNEIVPEMEIMICTEHASYLESAFRKFEDDVEDAEALGVHLVSLNFVEIFQKSWKQNFSTIVQDDFCKTKCSNFLNLLDVMYNLSGKSTIVCERIHKTELHLDMFEYLESIYLRTKLREKKKTRIIVAIIGMLHNVVRKASGACEALRACNAVERIQPFRDCSIKLVYWYALMLQSYLVTEAENEKINSNDEVFQLMISFLEASVNKDGYMGIVCPAVEMLEVLNKLASNDDNKERIVKNGALPHYVTLMSTEWTAEEQAEAAHGIWILSFKCMDEIKKQPGCIEALKVLTGHSNERVRTQAEGALWILEEKDKQAFKNISLRANKGKDDSHVFISYQWDSKVTALKVKDQLKTAGFRVWIDEDDMYGSVMDAMATAVEKASIVIICLSQKYKDSPNCRAEAEYTFRLKKKIVPLRLQTKYYPDGWLGLMVGSKLVLDFSEPLKIQKSTTHLMKELISATREVDETDAIVPQSATLLNAPNCSANEKASSIELWSVSDVERWVNENNLNNVKDLFSGFDGSLLLELVAMRKKAPDTFFSKLPQNLSLRDTLAIGRALDKL